MQYGFENYSATGSGYGSQSMSYGSSYNQYNNRYQAPLPAQGYYSNAGAETFVHSSGGAVRGFSGGVAGGFGRGSVGGFGHSGGGGAVGGFGHSGGGGAVGAFGNSGGGAVGAFGGGGLGGLLGGELAPTSFPPGTDPKMIECFNRMDKDGDGSISDYELFCSLSTYGHKFSMRTVHLLINMFAAPKCKVIGPKEFIQLFSSLRSWKEIFQRFDSNRNGRMEGPELKAALMRLGCNVHPAVVRLLVSKFDRTGGNCNIGYDDFIECCCIIKGLTNNFKCKEGSYWDTAEFTYDEFFLSVLPLIVA